MFSFFFVFFLYMTKESVLARLNGKKKNEKLNFTAFESKIVAFSLKFLQQNGNFPVISNTFFFSKLIKFFLINNIHF